MFHALYVLFENCRGKCELVSFLQICAYFYHGTIVCIYYKILQCLPSWSLTLSVSCFPQVLEVVVIRIVSSYYYKTCHLVIQTLYSNCLIFYAIVDLILNICMVVISKAQSGQLWCSSQCKTFVSVFGRLGDPWPRLFFHKHFRPFHLSSVQETPARYNFVAGGCRNAASILNNSVEQTAL